MMHEALAVGAVALLDEVIEQAREAHYAGAWDEALRLAEHGFARLAREGTPMHAARLLHRIGALRAARSEDEIAEELLEASLAVARLNELPQETADALLSLGNVALSTGRLEAAEDRFAASLQFAAAAGDAGLVAMVHQNRGIVAAIRGDADAALAHLGSALRAHRRAGNTRLVLQTLINIGIVHSQCRRWEEAERCFRNALRRVGDSHAAERVELQRGLAELYARWGRYTEAMDACRAAEEGALRLDHRPSLGALSRVRGVLARELGDGAAAELFFARAVEIARACVRPLDEAEAQVEWAVLHLSNDRHREGLACLNEAHRIFQALGAKRELLDIEQRLDRLEEVYLRIVREWAETIESKDRYTAGHCQRVADYACRLAEAAGFTGRDLVWFRMGAYLHDVGKIAIPAAVLNSPAALTQEEWRQIRSHPVVGAEIVAALGFPWDIRPMIRSHHERWDGSGYPDGLRGEQIPLAARILSLADSYDAITVARSYQRAHSHEEAMAIMAGLVGRAFDPTLFALFQQVVAQPLDPPLPLESRA